MDAREALMVGRNSEGALVRRPLSPHLQAYNMLQFTSVLSIMHRLTGVALAFGALALTWFLADLAMLPGTGATEAPASVRFFGSIIGKVFLFGWTFALFYHMANGVRHMMWDAGYGFDLPTAALSAKVVIGASVALTVLTWIIVLVA